VAPLAVGATSGSAAAWRTTLSTYVIGDQDRVLQPELVDRFAERCDSVLRWPTSHSTYLSRPEDVRALVHDLL